MMPRWFTRSVVATLALLGFGLATHGASAQTPTRGGTLTVGIQRGYQDPRPHVLCAVQ